MEFSTPLTCCSMGVATDCSTSSALAPTYVVVTWMSGGVMSGYWEIGRRESDTAPTITVTIESTIATMGRRMKKFPIDHLEGVGSGTALAAAGDGPVCAGSAAAETAGAPCGAGAASSAGTTVALTVTPSRTFCAPS